MGPNKQHRSLKPITNPPALVPTSPPQSTREHAPKAPDNGTYGRPFVETRVQDEYKDHKPRIWRLSPLSPLRTPQREPSPKCFRRVDSQTVVPLEVFQGMMKLGEEARARGAHRLHLNHGGRANLLKVDERLPSKAHSEPEVTKPPSPKPPVSGPRRPSIPGATCERPEKMGFVAPR
jgi:hypothetical protein